MLFMWCLAYVAQKSRPTQPGGVTHDCLAFGAYHQNQSTNHIEVDSCEGKKLPKYYIFVVEHLYLHLVIYM